MNTLRFLSLALLAGSAAGSFVGGASAKPAAAKAQSKAPTGRAAVAKAPAAPKAAAAKAATAVVDAPVEKPKAVPTSVVYPSSADLIPQGRYLWEKITSFGKPKRTAIITGASSGLGRQGARSLLESGDWHVVFACRDVQKACEVAAELGLKTDDYTVMKLDLASLDSVREFVKTFEASGRPCDALVCNAAVYLPNQPGPTYTVDGFEESMGVNHLGHFLLVNLMLPIVQKSNYKRVIIVGSITGNTNTLGGGFVWPRADLGELQGWDQTLDSNMPVPMADGNDFNGAKAYKDAKLCNMLTVGELNRRYHDKTGITFSTLYPGCIATTALFRQKRDWFRVWFPLFQKYVIGGFVSEEEAGDRLAQVVASDECKKSGVYWSWNGKAQGVGTLSAKDGFIKPQGAGGSGGEIFEGELSKDASDLMLASRIWDRSAQLVGLTGESVAVQEEQ